MADVPLFWRTKGITAQLLRPLSWLYRVAAGIKKVHAKPVRLPVPVIVIGNITAGGSGKTPVVIALVKALAARGIRAGVISRGYGGSNAKTAGVLEVEDSSNPAVCGDEPLLIKRAAGCPVAVGRDRAKAGAFLLARYPEIDVLLTDDGLQHYRLARDVEIAVIAPDLGLGNGFCIPAGPLREPASRLNSVDAVLFSGGRPAAVPHCAVPAFTAQTQAAGFADLQGRAAEITGEVTAAAAIARPQRFFNALKAQGVTVTKTLAFSDHSAITPDDLPAEGTVVITAKDAVKTGGWPARLKARTAVLAYHAVLSDEFVDFVVTRTVKP